MIESAAQQTIDFQNILREASVTLMRLQKPKRLLKLITGFINRELKLSHTSILVLEDNRKHFIFIDSKGRKRFPVGFLKFEMNHPFVRWFSRSRRPVRIYDDFLTLPMARKWFQDAGTKEGEREFNLGVVENALDLFNAEIVIPAYEKKTLCALLMLGKKKDGSTFGKAEISFFQTLAHTCAIAIKAAQHHEIISNKNAELQRHLKEIHQLHAKEKQTYQQILRSLAQEVHERDPYTYGHVNQVERLGMMTARELQLDLSENRKEILSAALILHDIGKIGIPDHILNKPAKLNPDEWKIMQTHVIKGVRILEHVDLFKEVAEIIHCHHERFDGSGYPRGRRGDEIPIESRIISVVDAFHAIVSKRVYDAERPVEEAFSELTHAAGTQFDPKVVEAFIRAQKREMTKRGVRSQQAAEVGPVETY